jgi:hypothetical protein
MATVAVFLTQATSTENGHSSKINNLSPPLVPYVNCSWHRPPSASSRQGTHPSAPGSPCPDSPRARGTAPCRGPGAWPIKSVSC